MNSASVVVRILSGLISTKVLAIFVGVEGIAILGNLRNFISALDTFSILGFRKGIVKYVAQYKDDTDKLRQVLSTVVMMILAISVILFMIIYFNTSSIEAYLFKTNNVYIRAVKIIPFVFPLYAFNVFLLSVINGALKLKKHIRISILSHILSLIITVFLVWQYEVKGAMVAVIVIPALIFFVSVTMSFQYVKWIRQHINLKHFSFEFLKKLSGFSVMALFSAIFVPFVEIQIRNFIIESEGVADAGYWESMLRISKYYLTFAMSLIALYLLPKYVVAKTNLAIKQEILKFCKTIIPIFAVGLVGVYFLRFFIIKLVLTEEFLLTEELFSWQLFGDFIKVLSSVLATLMLVKRMIWKYLITEGISVLSLYVLSVYFVKIYGVEGAVMAHFVNNILYFIMMFFIFRKILFANSR
jgi:PST family polysaccharide transporter